MNRIVLAILWGLAVICLPASAFAYSISYSYEFEPGPMFSVDSDNATYLHADLPNEWSYHSSYVGQDCEKWFNIKISFMISKESASESSVVNALSQISFAADLHGLIDGVEDGGVESTFFSTMDVQIGGAGLNGIFFTESISGSSSGDYSDAENYDLEDTAVLALSVGTEYTMDCYAWLYSDTNSDHNNPYDPTIAESSAGLSNFSWDLSILPVPEPATFLLFLPALLGLMIRKNLFDRRK